MTDLNRWQNPEHGFPTDDYFGAVERALMDAGITIADGWRDELWDFTLKLGDGYTKGYAALYISWRVDEESDPLTSGWRALQSGICGWYWVPYSDPHKALGDRAVDLGLEVLAEPEKVAAAIIALVRPGGEASC